MAAGEQEALQADIAARKAQIEELQAQVSPFLRACITRDACLLLIIITCKSVCT